MITNIEKRNILFLVGCIGFRSFLVYFSRNLVMNNSFQISNFKNKDVLKFMGYIAILISFGFFYIYITGSRKTGAEVFGDKIWWNNLRPIHGMLYLTFGLLAITNNKNSWKVLLLDVIIGLSAFTYNRLYQ